MENITLNLNVAGTPPLNIMGYSDLGFINIRLCILTEGLAIAVVFVIVIVLTSLLFCYFLVDTWP